jgi:hypothetical protein
MMSLAVIWRQSSPILLAPFISSPLFLMARLTIPPIYSLALLILLFFAALSAADELAHTSESHVDDGFGQDDDIELEDMTDEQLEEICTSRGFELVRELNATTGEPLMYTHQDYVDAASECLQIEADIEEILTTHPEILEDLKKESERMMHERDRLQQQLDQLQVGDVAADEQSESSPWGLRGKGTDTSLDETLESVGRDHKQNETLASSNTSSEELTKTTEPIFDFKEITQEVMKQMKADMTRLLNIILPKHLRDQITPSLKSFGLIAKDMCMSTYDLLRRHLKAFLDRGGSTGDVIEEEVPEEEVQTQQSS